MAQKSRIRLLKGERDKIADNSQQNTLLKGELLLDTTDNYLFAGINDGDSVNNSSNIISTNK